MKKLEERIGQAQRGGPAEIATLLNDPAMEVLDALLRNPFLEEGHLIKLLRRRDLPGTFLETLAKNPRQSESPRVKAAIVLNPRTPRLVSIGLLKFLYLFDLVGVTLTPAVPAEIKRLAENQIINQLEQLPLGQGIALARRGSARVAAEMLLSGREELLGPSLESSRLTEAELVRVMGRRDAPLPAIRAIAVHKKWSQRYDVRVQLVRNPKTPLGQALEFLPSLRTQDLELLATDKQMNPALRDYLKAEVERRRKSKREG